MNKLAIILSHLKENKAFYVILVLNCTISFGLLYFIENHDLIEHRFEFREDINKDHKAHDSLSTDIHYKSNRYISTTSVRITKQTTFNDNLERFLFSCIGLRIHPKMTCNSISILLERQFVIELQKKMKNQIRVL